MRTLIKKISAHPLISGSTVIVIGSMLGNLFNYIFTLSMGRLLTVGEYGTLASLISLFNIFIVFSATVITVFSKFSASFVGRGKEGAVGTLLRKGNIYVGMMGILICLPLIILSPFVSNFLHIQANILIILISLALFFSFLASTGSGILQGLLQFNTFSFIYTTTTFSKFLFGLILVLLGWRVLGATFAILLATIISFFVSLVAVRKYLKKRNVESLHIPNLKKELSAYGIPVFLSGMGLTLIYTVDLILIKHFFSANTAGHYAALSLMGRSIFFIISPITLVFFPLIAQKRERKEKLAGTLLLTVVLVGLPSLVLSFVYFVFPNMVLQIFFPAKEYAILAPYLGIFSIFILFYTFIYFLNSFFLSIGRVEVWIFTMTAALAEILYILFFHASLWSVIWGITGISFLLFISLLIYYFAQRRR